MDGFFDKLFIMNFFLEKALFNPPEIIVRSFNTDRQKTINNNKKIKQQKDYSKIIIPKKNFFFFNFSLISKYPVHELAYILFIRVDFGIVPGLTFSGILQGELPICSDAFALLLQQLLAADAALVAAPGDGKEPDLDHVELTG